MIDSVIVSAIRRKKVSAAPTPDRSTSSAMAAAVIATYSSLEAKTRLRSGLSTSQGQQLEDEASDVTFLVGGDL